MDRLTMFKAHGSVGKVDKEAGIIHGVSVISVGEAKGHEMFIDSKMVRQVVKQGKDTGEVGLKARFGHPDMCNDGVGSEIGRFKNFRKDGDQARADLHLLEAAKVSPKGNLSEFILTLADEDPDMFATSIVFSMADPETVLAGEDDDPEDPEFAFPHARLQTLTHCDVVDEGAANDGFFSSVDYTLLNAKGFIAKNLDTLYEAFKPILNKHKMSDENKGFLKSAKEFFGLGQDAKVEELQAALNEANKANEELAEANEVVTEKVEEKVDKVDELAAVVEEKEEVVVEKDSKIEKLSSKIAELTKTVETLSNVKLGETVEVVATETVQEPKEVKSAKVGGNHKGPWAELSRKAEKHRERLLAKEEKETK